eukprot:g3681.t1
MRKQKLFDCWKDAGLDQAAFGALVDQGLTILDQNIQTEVAQLCEERQLDGKFAALDEMVKAQPVSSRTGQRRVGPSAANPLDMVRDARVNVKRDERMRLQGIIAEMQKENETARTEVKIKSVRVQDAKQKLAKQQSELEQATACLGTLGL